MRRSFWLLAFVALVAGCTTARESFPPRTATEQMLISSATDRAAENLNLDLPPGAAVFVDDTYFEGTDRPYAVAAVREQLARLGARLVPTRERADYVVELRAGALSIDQEATLVGLPRTDIPIPLAGPLGLPELALFKKEERRGVAKIAAVAYGAEDGRLADATAPQYGFSRETHWVVLLFFSWTTGDYGPPEARGPWFDIETPEFAP